MVAENRFSAAESPNSTYFFFEPIGDARLPNDRFRLWHKSFLLEKSQMGNDPPAKLNVTRLS
jgi:hypothetical protein